MRLAAKVSANVMKSHFIPEMSTLIDEEKPITHEKLSELTESVLDLDNAKFSKKVHIPQEVRKKLAIIGSIRGGTKAHRVI